MILSLVLEPVLSELHAEQLSSVTCCLRILDQLVNSTISVRIATCSNHLDMFTKYVLTPMLLR